MLRSVTQTLSLLAILLVFSPAIWADTTASLRTPRSINHNDPNLHLFVDDEEIESVENLQRALNRPRKHPEPLIVSDKPWEGDRVQAWGSVILEPDGLLRMYYVAYNSEWKDGEEDRGGYCYAESRDAIHWEKPNLGVVEFKGSKDNNFFYSCNPDGKNLVEQELARRRIGLPAVDLDGKPLGVVNSLDGMTVVRDDNEPDPNKRYKLIANMQDHRMWGRHYKHRYPNLAPEEIEQARTMIGQYLDTSPDGIHWTRRPTRLFRNPYGDYMMVTPDFRNNRWWLNERAPGRVPHYRTAALRTSDDLIHWTDPVVQFDNMEDSDYGRKFQWHGGMTPFNYGNINLGFLEKRVAADFGNTCELVCNRDGGPWKRVASGTPFLDIGPEGSFDRVLIHPTHNPPVRIGDQLYIFYTGGGVKQTNPEYGTPMSIGVATIGLDRFVALANWRATVGRLVTKPVTVGGSALQINVEQLEAIPVRVAISSADGAMLEGYSFEDCQTDHDPNRIYSPVRWKDKPDLSELRGQQVKLHFKVEGGAIYSYRFLN